MKSSRKELTRNKVLSALLIAKFLHQIALDVCISLHNDFFLKILFLTSTTKTKFGQSSNSIELTIYLFEKIHRIT